MNPYPEFLAGPARSNERIAGLTTTIDPSVEAARLLRVGSPAGSPPTTWPHNTTVIAHFSRGNTPLTAGRFRIVCVPSREPSVEVSVTDTDALGVSVQRWTAARDFDKVKVAQILRDALLKAFAILPPFTSSMLYAPGVVARDGHIEIELGSLPS